MTPNPTLFVMRARIAELLADNERLRAALAYLVEVCDTASKPLARTHNALLAARAALAVSP